MRIAAASSPTPRNSPHGRDIPVLTAARAPALLRLFATAIFPRGIAYFAPTDGGPTGAIHHSFASSAKKRQARAKQGNTSSPTWLCHGEQRARPCACGGAPDGASRARRGSATADSEQRR